MFNAPSDSIMHPSKGFIKWTDSDACRTGCAIDRPELKALHRIQGPAVQPRPVGNIVDFRRWLPVGNGLSRTVLGTLTAYVAEIPYAEFNGFVRDKR